MVFKKNLIKKWEESLYGRELSVMYMYKFHNSVSIYILAIPPMSSTKNIDFSIGFDLV